MFVVKIAVYVGGALESFSEGSGSFGEFEPWWKSTKKSYAAEIR